MSSTNPMSDMHTDGFMTSVTTGVASIMSTLVETEPETVETETVEPETVETETVETETVEPEVVEAEVVEVEPETVAVETVVVETVEPEPVEPETAEVETVEPEPVEPEVVEPEPETAEVEPEVVAVETVEPETVEVVEPEPETVESDVEPESVESDVEPESDVESDAEPDAEAEAVEAETLDVETPNVSEAPATHMSTRSVMFSIDHDDMITEQLLVSNTIAKMAKDQNRLHTELFSAIFSYNSLVKFYRSLPDPIRHNKAVVAQALLAKKFGHVMAEIVPLVQ